MADYQLLRSRRKTLALEITRDCRVLVRAPMRLSKARIDAFVSAHADWIAAHLETQRQRAAARPPEPTEAEIAALKERARTELPPKIAAWSARMGVQPTGFRVTASSWCWGDTAAVLPEGGYIVFAGDAGQVFRIVLSETEQYSQNT